MEQILKEKCVNLFNAGKNINEICEELQLKYYQVYNVVKSLKKHRFEWTDLLLYSDDIIDMYHSGNSTVVIGKKYGTTHKPIIRLLDYYGIDRTGVGRRRYNVNENYFDEINTPAKAYILGFLSADGSNNRKKSTVSISLEECDKEILEKINIEMENEHPLEFLDYSNKHDFGYNYKNQYRLLVFSSHMCDSLIKHGVVPNKSLQLTFPQNLNNEFYSHFIRGVFDGDGSMGVHDVSVPHPSLSISITSTYSFCKSIQDILNELNINSRITDASCHNGITSMLYISRKSDVKTFLDWIYKDAEIYLARKYDIYADFYGINNSLSA